MLKDEELTPEYWRGLGITRQPMCPDPMPCPSNECLGGCKSLEEWCEGQRPPRDRFFAPLNMEQRSE